MNNQLPDEFRTAPKYFKTFLLNHYYHLAKDVKLIQKDEKSIKRWVIALVIICISAPIAVTLGILQVVLR